MTSSSAWSPERRERQRQLIRCIRPWERSTGPRTKEGKARSSQNAKRSSDLIAAETYLKILDLRSQYLTAMYSDRYDPDRLTRLSAQIAVLEATIDPNGTLAKTLEKMRQEDDTSSDQIWRP